MDGIPRVSYFGDVVSNFFYRNPKVYFGFTGSTGPTQTNDQHFHIVKADINLLEICGNGIDDNCNGLVDEDCCGSDVEKWKFANQAYPSGPEDNVVTSGAANQSGAVWYNAKANLNNPFDFSFNIYLGANDAGAEVWHSSCTMTRADKLPLGNMPNIWVMQEQIKLRLHWQLSLILTTMVVDMAILQETTRLLSSMAIWQVRLWLPLV